jgi:segregation and condensation protein A
MPPTNDYRVELDAYSGPLDLLMYLVRRHEIDLNDIPIAKLTEQYLDHLRAMQRLDVNVAGDFLVMAATLLEIKSAMLLPRPEAVEGEADSASELLDPRHELVQQLMAYKQFKEAAAALDERRQQWQARFAVRPNHPGKDTEEAAELELDLEDIDVAVLCEAFARILDSIGASTTHDVVYDDTPIALHAEDILDRIRRDGSMTLQSIFVGRSSRSEMVGLFLAMLELVRQKKVRVAQEQVGGPIQLELRSDRDDVADDGAEPSWRDPVTGEVQYEWPSDEIRRQAERRGALRGERLKQQRFEADDGPAAVIDVDGPAAVEPGEPQTTEP